MRNTVIFTVATVGISMALGLGLALLLDQKLRGRNLVRSVVFAPFVISGAAIGIAFQFVFDPQFGLVRDLLARIGVASPDFYQQPGWALFMVTVTYIWKNLGYTFVIYLAALQGRRADLDEAAEIDGASAWTRFRRVLMPQLRPTTFFLSITVLLSSVQVFDIINVMTRGGPQGNGTTTLVYQVYQETFVNQRAGYGATVATVMFVILLAVTVVQVRVHGQGADRHEHVHGRRGPRRGADALRCARGAGDAARRTTSRPRRTTAARSGRQRATPAWSSSSSSSPSRSSGSSSRRSRSAATSTSAPPSGGPTRRRARTTAS